MYFDDTKGGMFPKWLLDPHAGRIENPLELSTVGGSSCNFLDITISIDEDGVLGWQGYDKRDGMFVLGEAMSALRNFPHSKTSLSDSCKYPIVTSELCRFARVFKNRFAFADKVVQYTRELIKGGYDQQRVVQKIKNFGMKWSKGKWPPLLRHILKHFRGSHPRAVRT